jgi:hypothetical protein
MNRTFELTRVWAAITGLALALWFFGCLYLGLKPAAVLPLLIGGIGGFELVLFTQDLWIRHRRPSR